MREAELNLEYTTVTAPVGGRVTRRTEMSSRRATPRRDVGELAPTPARSVRTRRCAEERSSRQPLALATVSRNRFSRRSIRRRTSRSSWRALSAEPRAPAEPPPDPPREALRDPAAADAPPPDDDDPPP